MRPVQALLGASPACALLIALGLAGSVAAPGDAAARTHEPVAKDARLAGDRTRTRFIADLSKKVGINVFSLANPYRVIVDLPEVNFQMPPGLGTEQRGLVTGYRYGLFAPGKSRIVIDMSGPFLVDKAFVLDARQGQPARLVIDLVPTDRATFLAKLKAASPADPDRRVDHAAAAACETGAREARGRPRSRPWRHRSRHQQRKWRHRERGGARLRQDARSASSKRTASTRSISPAREIVSSRSASGLPSPQSKGANLLVSIHADSFPKQPEEAKGATVYTLSERASDDEAKELAAKENLSDAIAGVDLPNDSDSVVANILIDLAQRETQNRSIVFAKSSSARSTVPICTGNP